MRTPNHAVVLTDDLAIYLMELPKFKKTVTELTDPLDIWLYFLRHAETLDPDVLPAALDVPVFHQAMEELKVLTQDDLERERFEARLKLERDALSRERQRVRSIAEAEAKMAQAEAEAAQAEAAGILIGRIHLGQRLRQQPLTPVEELRALSLAELNRFAEKLENELFMGQSRNQGT